MEFDGTLGGMMGSTIWLLVLELVVYFGTPLLMVWMIYRYYRNKTNKRAQIIQAIIEKNPDAGNVEELMKKIAPKQKLLKEKLLAKLLWGCVISFLGFSLFGCGLWKDIVGGSSPDTIHFLYFLGFALFGIGLALVIYYFVGKKMLAKEIEAEEKSLIHNS